MSVMHRRPRLAEIEIDNHYRGKPKNFDRWRGVVAEIVGAPIGYITVERTVHFDDLDPSITPPETLEFVEVQVMDAKWQVRLTPETRWGIWPSTPEEPLWVLLLLTIPGGTLFARHAQAIADRLDEIDELLDYVDKGWSTDVHQRFRRSFAEQARSGKDVVVKGGYEPTGWWDVDLARVDL